MTRTPRDRSRGSWTLRLAVLALGLSVSGGPVIAEEQAALSPREVVELVGGAVVRIEAEVEGDTSQGSGFLVGDNGAIVTCLHVIDGASRVTVSLRDGTKLEDVAVRAFDIEKDLAVLVADFPIGDAHPVTIALGDTESIDSGSRILIIANPLGLDHTVTEGIVSAWREPGKQDSEGVRGENPALRGLPPGRLLQISATISPGSSGGPVLNERAEVIGVATSGLLWGMAGLNFAVPVDALPALLEQDGAMDLETFGERADNIRRDLARPYFDDGRIAYERGDIEEATELLERALQLCPRYAEALLFSGRIAMERGRVELAQRRFTLATEVDEYDADAWYHLGDAHRLKALAGGATAELARAETAFEKALEIDERHGKAALGLARIQIEKGALDRAEELLISAIDNEPGLTDAHYTLGEVHLRQGRPDEAREAFEQALWQDDDHAPSHFGLALLYMHLESVAGGAVATHGRAADHWEEFLRLSEDDPALAENREIALFYIKQHYPHLLD